MPKSALKVDQTSLFEKAENGRFKIEKVNSFLKDKPAATITYEDGNTLLHYAAKFNNGEVTSLLLEAGADPHQENDVAKA